MKIKKLEVSIETVDPSVKSNYDDIACLRVVVTTDSVKPVVSTIYHGTDDFRARFDDLMDIAKLSIKEALEWERKKNG